MWRNKNPYGQRSHALSGSDGLLWSGIVSQPAQLDHRGSTGAALHKSHESLVPYHGIRPLWFVSSYFSVRWVTACSACFVATSV